MSLPVGQKTATLEQAGPFARASLKPAENFSVDDLARCGGVYLIRVDTVNDLFKCA
jgi:hypothetical protein